MALYNWTDGELVTAKKLNDYGSGMEAIKSDAETAKTGAETAEANAKAAQAGAEAAKTAAETTVDTAIATNLGGLVFSVTADGLLHIEQKEG